jgi:hypothetical protein
MGAPIVVKADGLAAGKGVVVAMTTGEAHEAIDFMLLDNKLGVSHNAGGARVVIEEFLQGEEASFIVLCDGKNVTALATSQDHKRLLDGDEGPNTGGMGAYSPAPVVTPAVHAGHARGHPAHHARHGKGRHPVHRLPVRRPDDRPAGHIKTLEFNCRMGDPETQPILMRLKSDLFDVMLAATAGTLDQVELQWDRRTALGVVMAAAGYPLSPRKGDAITGLPRDAGDAMVFHAATAAQDGQLVTSGGRVLCVTALADRREGGAAARLRGRGGHPLRRRPVPPRHRPPRRQGLTVQQADAVRAYLLDLQGASRRPARRRSTAARSAPTRGARTRASAAGRRRHHDPGAGAGARARRGRLLARARAAAAALGHPAPARAGGAPFEAMGVSLVFHPRNPYAPTVHMNVRMISATLPASGAPAFWFGGGMDLTPCYGFDDDAVHFHQACRDALEPFGPTSTRASSSGATSTSA